MILKDVRKYLSHKKGNETLIWSWNDSDTIRYFTEWMVNLGIRQVYGDTNALPIFKKCHYHPKVNR